MTILLDSPVTSRDTFDMVAIQAGAQRDAEHDERWYEALADERERTRLAQDPACVRQRRMFGPVRIVGALAFLLGILGLVIVVQTFGVGAGLLAVWALPMLVLGVVLAAERVLVRFAK
jgi:hypothetical protein